MPVADFAGGFGWGYDGVDLFAPTRLYGTPDDLRALRRPAHAAGIGVILDVVYNHLGPDGNYLPRILATTTSPTATTTTGATRSTSTATNCGPVREFFVAERALLDRRVPPRRPAARRHAADLRRRRRPHVIAEIARAVREAAGGALTLIVAENEPQDDAPRRGRRSRAATASTRCGTTTSTTAPWSR